MSSELLLTRLGITGIVNTLMRLTPLMCSMSPTSSRITINPVIKSV